MKTLGEVAGEREQELEVLELSDALQAKEQERAEASAMHTERALLSGLLIGGLDVFDDIEEVGLLGHDFQRDEHGAIFDAVRSLHVARTPIDSVTVVEELKQSSNLDSIGGPSAVASLATLMASTAHCPAYARMVFNNSHTRALAELGRVVVRRAERGKPWQEIVDYAELSLTNLQRSNQSGDVVDLPATVKEAIAALPAMGGAVQGERTGFTDVDNLLRFRPGELIIIAARPSMGKTAFVLDCLRYTTLVEQKAAAFFSLEQDALSVVTREIAAESRVPSTLKAMTPAQVQRLTLAAQNISAAPQFIDETPGISIGEIRAKARALHRKYKLAVIFIDYLSLVQAPNPEASKQQQTADVSQAMKNLARELKVPVVCLSQLNRGVEARPNKRPVMSDLRDSGAIEQDADIIIFLYRDEYYYGAKNNKAGIAEVIVAKHRNGPTDTVELHFTKDLPRFDNLSRHSP